ncbi:hypothetical protein DFH06DRAFT_1471416 [Mycena polygramma]|nr:hypothetical protein DFH06DRAFT_1471416 [Mycena polygramma]
MLTHGYLDKVDDDYAETLIDAPTTSLPRSREGAEPSLFQTSHGLRFLSVVLHSLLVAIFLTFLIVSLKEAEHRVVFSLDHQKTVSFAITAITTGFGTIYLGILVYVTQTISMRRILQTDQTLTAIHDSTAAWAGIGSAVYHLWHQTRVRGSVIGVLSIFCYLGGVLVLHVVTPALFAVQTFNSSSLVQVGTHGLPSWNADWSNGTNVGEYTQRSLYAIPNVVESNTSLGLHGGTLYDVLDDNAGVGNVTVSATGFNISCTYATNITVISNDDYGPDVEILLYELQANGIPNPFYMQPAQYGVISAMNQTDDPYLRYDQYDGITYESLAVYGMPPPGPLLLFSTIPMIDSTNSHPPMTTLNTTPTTENHNMVHVLNCVQSLVPQTAVVDAQSHRIITVEPDIQKTASAWVPLDTEPSNITTSGNPFLDGWAQWYLTMPTSNFPFDPAEVPLNMPFVSVGATYLIEKLGMHPPASEAAPENVTLHDLENALSTLVASMFWTLGHLPPTSGQVQTTIDGLSVLSDVLPPPQLLRGHATVTQMSTQGRLDLNIIAILIGLGMSVFVTALTVPSLLRRNDSEDNNIPIDGTGILHAIWLYRNHSGLDASLPQVELPTTNALRKAGMIRTKLYDGYSRLLRASHTKTHDTFLNKKDSYTEVSGDLDFPTASLRKSPEVGARSESLIVLSAILHSVLVVIHVALSVLWAKGTEHQVIFSLVHQKTVSFAITAITTGFGTTYLGLVIFVTQTLALRRILQTEQTLTAIHDTVAAWSGIGSAVVHLWRQTGVRGSFIGVLSVFLSLSSAVVLHVSTPALFAVQTFTTSRPVGVGTQSLPSWNNHSSNEAYADDYVAGSLSSLPMVIASNVSVGLIGGTLYDVPDDNAGVGNTTVEAIGFNISCYSQETSGSVKDFHVLLDGISAPVYFSWTQYGVISALKPGIMPDLYQPPVLGMPDPAPLLLYSTIPIVDSSNNHPPMATVPDDVVGLSNQAPIQFLQCNQALVQQAVVMDAQSHHVLAVEPDIRKTSSAWVSYHLQGANVTTGNIFLDAWAEWYLHMPPSSIPLDPAADDGTEDRLSVGAAYLFQTLQMYPSTINGTMADAPKNVTLHDLENSLSILVASMFWTLGHAPAKYGAMSYTENGTYTFFQDALPPPLLIRGNATVTEVLTQGRLDLNIIAIGGGLVASIVLTLLAIPSLLSPKGTANQNIPIDGTGFLHAIWLLRNHPELDALLPQVEYPTTDNLRAAGMVRTRLL